MSIWGLLREDLANARSHDPAARGDLENALIYSGLHAIWVHRLSHKLWNKGHRGIARLLSPVSYTHLTLPTILLV